MLLDFPQFGPVAGQGLNSTFGMPVVSTGRSFLLNESSIYDSGLLGPTTMRFYRVFSVGRIYDWPK